MRPRKSREILAVLERKGFKRRETHHTYLYLYVDGKRTAVKTKVSHGRSEYGRELQRRMATQLHLTPDEFDALIECSLSFETYCALLLEREVLRREPVARVP